MVALAAKREYPRILTEKKRFTDPVFQLGKLGGTVPRLGTIASENSRIELAE
jgi:hypothetical protein